MAVGLPDGQMGNSEVGHTNMGAGRIVYQQLTLITKSIKDGEMLKNPVLVKNMQAAIDAGKAIHLMGLVGTGGVHSHADHWFGVDVSLRTVGAGTAVQETLSTLGLEKTEKAVLFAIITADSWPRIQKALRRQMRIDVPGTGIAFIVPVSSIGGKRALLFLTEHQTLELKEESTLKDTRYDLLLVIANQGYTGSIMDAARAAGAGGGTVIHAKGTGMEGAARFMGIDLVNEKELVLIVSRTSEKNAIMKAIMDNADKKAGSIVFSLPVTDTAGLRLLDEE